MFEPRRECFITVTAFVAFIFVEFLNAWEDVTGQDVVTMDICAARNIFFGFVAFKLVEFLKPQRRIVIKCNLTDVTKCQPTVGEDVVTMDTCAATKLGFHPSNIATALLSNIQTSTVIKSEACAFRVSLLQWDNLAEDLTGLLLCHFNATSIQRPPSSLLTDASVGFQVSIGQF